MSNFVHLSVHTEKSLTDSLVKDKKLIEAVSEMGMPAVALADHMNMFGMISFYEKCQAKGVKPLAATEIRLKDGEYEGNMTLIASNNDGYRNLMKILSEAYETGFEGAKSKAPTISREMIEKRSEGLIALTGARGGLLGQAIMRRDREGVQKELKWIRSTFGRENAYIEIQRTGLEKDESHLHMAAELAARNGYYVVATNPVRFLSHEDFRAHGIRSAINVKVTIDEFERLNADRYTPHMYLKSPEEMAELFEDIPEAVENTVAIARRCNVDLELGKNYLPQFPVPEGQTEAEFLREESVRGLQDRLDFEFGKDNPDMANIRKDFDERLDFELNVINNMGFPGYFLIVADFIQWSKENNIAVGPGRGSGAGSLVAYALGITDLNPLKYDLLFERFLNPERVSMPDFDVDFCMDRRDEVIAYVADKYGHKAVSQIVTFSTLSAKAVVRDVTRTLGYSYGVGNRISQMIPDTPNIKLLEAMDEVAAFKMAYNEDPAVREIVDYSLTLEGMSRQTGKHAGGVLIAPGELSDFTPTYNGAEGDGFVSQYDKNDVETAGLVKFDFLGLRTLTIIQNAVNAINAKQEDQLDINAIALDDPGVVDILQKGETSAVFQLESRGMKELLRRLKPDCFEDLIALVALYRPGPLQSGMVDNFVNRKHGREEISYPNATYQHELLKPILEPTYGIILYQEQVMQIAQVLAGYTLGEADMLRRAMGKKKPEEMAKQRSVFAEGAKKKGIDPELAAKIFDLVEKFAGYGFNKSHSAAYALISYQTGWLKEHYPAEFMASVLSSDMDKTDKVVGFMNEARRMGLTIKQPSINESESHFVANEKGEIIYGLGAIKGVGGQALIKISEERKANGEYTGVFDFIKRVNPNKRVLSALIRSGAFDQFEFNRATLMANYELAQVAARAEIKVDQKKNAGKAMGELFDDAGIGEINEITGFKRHPEYHKIGKLMGERETLGLFLTGHPMESVRKDMPKISESKLSDILESPMDTLDDVVARDPGITTIAGVVMDFEIKTGSKGQMAVVKLDDGTGQIDVSIFNKAFGNSQHMLKKDAILQVGGRVKTNRKSGAQRFMADDVKDLNMIRESVFSGISIDLEKTNMTDDLKDSLNELMDKQPRGLCQVMIRTDVGGKKKLMPLGRNQISLTDAFIGSMRNMFGEEAVSLIERNSKLKTEIAKDNASRKADLKETGRLTADQRREKRAKLFADLEMAMSA